MRISGMISLSGMLARRFSFCHVLAFMVKDDHVPPYPVISLCPPAMTGGMYDKPPLVPAGGGRGSVVVVRTRLLTHPPARFLLGMG